MRLVLKKWGQSIVEFLIFFPGLLIIGINVIPIHLLWICLGSIPAYYLIGLIAGRFLKRNRTITHILVGMIISGVGAYFLFDMQVYVFFPWICGVVAFVRGIRLRGTRWEDMFPAAGMWVGFVIYFIAYFLFSRVENFKPFSEVVGWTGIVYMVLVLFIINFSQLKSASLPGDKEPVLPNVIKKNNRVLIIIMLLVTTVVCFFDNLRKAVEWVVDVLGYLIRRFIAFLVEIFAPVQQGPSNSGGGGGISGLFPPVEERPPSIWDKIVDVITIILSIVAGLVLLCLICFTLYKLFKKIAAWLSRFYQLGKDTEDYGGYVDEKESLIDFRELRKDYGQRFRQWLTELMEKEPKWDELKTNKERIRYIYRNLLIRSMSKGYSFKKNLTPVEIGKELSEKTPEKSQDMGELITAYDDARYGDKEIEDSRMEKLIQAFLKE